MRTVTHRIPGLILTDHEFTVPRSAERVRVQFPEFDLGPDKPVLFTGEMVYPWMTTELEVRGWGQLQPPISNL